MVARGEQVHLKSPSAGFLATRELLRGVGWKSSSAGNFDARELLRGRPWAAITVFTYFSLIFLLGFESHPRQPYSEVKKAQE